MRILLTSDIYKPATNGVVTSLVNLQQGLIALGHEVRILTLSETHTTYYQDGVWYLSSLNSGTIYPGTRVRDTLARKPLKDLINWKPDVVHTQSEFSTFPLARRIASAVHAPLVHTYHTLYEDYTSYFSPNKRMGKAMAQFLSRIILSKTDTVIAPTSKIERLLHAYGVKTPIETIPSGIDLSSFEPSQAGNSEALKKKLGITAGNKVIVYVGRLAKEKNIDELIINFPKEEEALTLLLVGDGPEREHLQSLVARLGMQDKVIFAGMQKPQDIPSYYQVGDVFCSASMSETQGLTYVEALAAGLPILCRADDCLLDLVQDGCNGYQYNTQDEYHTFLKRICSDERLRSQLSEEAVASSCRYDRMVFAQSVAAVYEKLVSGKETCLRLPA